MENQRLAAAGITPRFRADHYRPTAEEFGLYQVTFSVHRMRYYKACLPQCKTAGHVIFGVVRFMFLNEPLITVKVVKSNAFYNAIRPFIDKDMEKIHKETSRRRDIEKMLETVKVTVRIEKASGEMSHEEQIDWERICWMRSKGREEYPISLIR